MSEQQTYSLSDIDKLFDTNNIKPLSLSPERTVITPFETFEGLISQSSLDKEIQQMFRTSLFKIVESEIINFPNNIFWDHDYFIGDAFNQLQKVNKKDQIEFIQLFEKSTIRLMTNFGINSNIKFKYIHDFIFGYDWSKWVSDRPKLRGHLTPFSIDFLEYMFKRGLELIDLIKSNDEKYGALVQNSFRNPFTFIREPKSEYLLFQTIAAADMIPVQTWVMDAELDWKKPYYIYRKKIAAELNLKKNA